MSFSTADLMDAHGDSLQSCTLQFRQFGARHVFSGRARTLQTFEDNALVRELLAAPGDGAVLSFAVEPPGVFVTRLQLKSPVVVPDSAG